MARSSGTKALPGTRTRAAPNRQICAGLSASRPSPAWSASAAPDDEGKEADAVITLGTEHWPARGGNDRLGDQQPGTESRELIRVLHFLGQVRRLDPGSGGGHEVALGGEEVGERAGPVDVFDRPRNAGPRHRLDTVDERLITARAQPLQPHHGVAVVQAEGFALRRVRLVLGGREHERLGALEA